MFKKQGCLFTLFFAFVFLYNYAQSDSLYGNVKSVHSKIYILNIGEQKGNINIRQSPYGEFGVIKPENTLNIKRDNWYNSTSVSFLSNKKIYDQNRNIIIDTWFDQNEDFEVGFEYNYDNRNNKTQTKKIHSQNDFTVRNFYYDNLNQLISSIYYTVPETDIYSFTRNIFNSKNQLLESQHYTSEGDLSKYFYEYKNGLKIKDFSNPMRKWVQLDEKRSVWQRDSIGINYLKAEYRYDDKGNITEKMTYYEDENKSVFATKNTYEYDSKNRIIKEYNFNYKSKDSLYLILSYQYNEDNSITVKKREYINPNEKNNQWEYSYTKHNLIEKILIKKESQITTLRFNYKFDKVGNWIMQTKVVNGKKIGVWERKIEYY